MTKLQENIPLKLAGGSINLRLGLGLVLWLVAGSGCQFAHGQAGITAAASPDLTIGAAEYPGDDAIILRWEQHWTIERDGSVQRRDHKWIKLLNDRPNRATADPKLDFRQDEDEVIIHTAQTILPDGEILPVPEYSFALGAAHDVAGWPAYAAWKQRIICFSGVQPGATLELDYEVKTEAGVLPWVSADLRLDDDYPIVERIISVTVPTDAALLHHLDQGRSKAPIAHAKETSDDAQKHLWSFGPLPGSRGEPQSLPWQQRCPRLRWTSVPNVREWVAAPLKAIRCAAKADQAVTEFAVATIDGETDVTEQVHKIAEKIHDRFNFIDSPKAFRSLRCREAAEVLRSNYGNALEAGALCLAAVRSLGIDADVELAVDADTWNEQTPTESGFAGVVVVARAADGPVYAHPRHGVFTNPGHWGSHRLLTTDASGSLRMTDIRSRGEDQPSKIDISGKITLADDGTACGDLRIRLTGAFYDPRELETADDQQKFIKSLVGRLLHDMTVSGHSINILSAETLRASVSVSSEQALAGFGKRHLLKLGEGPAFLGDFPMPLERSYRHTDVRLRGRFREFVNLTVEIPEGWKIPIVPAALGPVVGDWGTIQQSAEVENRSVRLHRRIELATDTIPAEDFPAIRKAVNDLRADGSLSILVGP